MLSKFSVKKPYTVIVGVILVLILGVVSFSNMTADLLPDINLPYAMVMTTYAGASPEEVETVVSKPVEQALATVSNIENIQSVSSENMSMVILEFSQTTNMDSVSLEMREKLDQIRSFWDDSVGNPIIMKMNPDMMPIMVAAVEKEDLDSVGITNLVEKEILSELESLEGVASVSTSGEVKESVQVVIRQDKINSVNNKIADALGVTFADARKEMVDAEDELNDAQEKLDSGKAGMENGKNSMASQLSGAKSQLQSKQMDVWKTEVDLDNKLAQIESGEKELTASEAQLAEQEKALQQAEQAKAELPKKLEALETQKAQLETGISGLQALLDSGVPAQYGQLQTALQEAEQTLAEMEAGGTATAEEIAAQKQKTEMLQLQKAGIEQQLSSQLDAFGITDYTEEGVQAAITGLEKNLELAEGGINEIKAAQKKLPDEQTIAEGKMQIAAGREKIAAGKAQMASAKEQINSAKEQIASGKITLAQALAQLNEKEITATIEMASAQAQLISGQDKIDQGKEKLKEGKKQLEDSQDEALENAKLDDKVTPEMISQILTAQNFSMPAGYVTEEGIQYLVRVGDKFSNTEDMENLVLFDLGLDDLEPIRLSDVADVAVTDDSSEVYARINGRPGVLLTMQKQTGYSTGEVSDRIKDKFDTLMKQKEGLHITALMDQGIYIDLVVNSVMNNLISGAILAIIILFLFLKDIRPTAIVACSIPISVVGAVMLMYFSGISLNIISLSGLALGVGMLVDNSIVVIENIYRLRNLGVPIRKAAVQGARQVAAAITASTLTTVCVFLPIVFTKGITRQLFVDMGLTIGYSLLASLVIALTLVPAMSVGMLKKKKETRHPLLTRMASGYERIMEKVLRRKAPVLIAMVALLVLSTVLAVRKGTSFIPSMESTQASISLKMPEGSSVEETGAMADEVMARLEDIKDIEEMGAMAGGSGSVMGMGGGSTEEASVYLILSEKKELTGNQLADEIIKRTEDLDCELTVSTNNMDMSALGGSGIQVQIKGKELDTLQDIAGDVSEILEHTKGLEQISDGMEETTEELRLVVDKSAASAHNLTVAQIFQQVRTRLEEKKAATTLALESKDYDVTVTDEEQITYTREDVKGFTIEATDKEGKTEEIPLEELADFVPAKGPDAIRRDNQSRYITVSAVVSDGYNVGLLGSKVEKKLADYQIPEGYTVEMAGEDEMIRESMIEVMKMLGLAIVFIYLIMVAQFQSLLSPFIVMFTIPLAFTGGFLGLVVAGQEVSVIALIGFVMLSGIIVNNGIVLVDYVNQLRAGGMEKRKAIIQAGKTRMRPILMTALTTILGLSTMGMGVGMGSDMVQPMAVVTIGGLIYGTILTLFVVPCIYDILNRKEYHSDRENELDDTDYIPETVEQMEKM